MNIQQAKEQIMIAVRAYFSKDEFGRYRIPIEKQRPVFLMGPPGIGKTAIMEQIAQELNVGLVSYSMTHHTRQSALGLPFIAKKNYGGKEFSVSEYTMSEIIASVYDLMEETGVKEGILFLDEVNCVSETLAPSMLQFLQYKIFGRHRIPDGWIVVTAGNPPEFNKSVREFDVATWDRLKRIDVEPDHDVWKAYAANRGTHPAILTYLDIRKDDFYKIESTVDGKSFVTVRGWSDLSDMICLCEENGDKVDERLISQYIQNRKIARDFASYYDLFNKYRSDYQVDKILDGSASGDIMSRARKAKFDERLSLIGLLIDAVTGELHDIYNEDKALTRQRSVLKALKADLDCGAKPESALMSKINELRCEIDNGKRASSLSDDDERSIRKTIAALEKAEAGFAASAPESGKAAYDALRKSFNTSVKAYKKRAEEAGKKLSNMFKFCEEAFTEGQELVIIVTELTISKFAAWFISHYGCDEYFAHNKELLFYERNKEIVSEMEELEI